MRVTKLKGLSQLLRWLVLLLVLLLLSLLFPWRAGTQYGPELLGPHVEMTSKQRLHEVFRTNTKTSEFRAILGSGT